MVKSYLVVFAVGLVAVLCRPVGAEPVEIVGFIDDGYDVYINGTRLDLPPGKATPAELNEGDVIAVKVWDMQGGTRGGFAMSVTRRDGSFLVTDRNWRCSKAEDAAWLKRSFDDSKWDRAKKVDRDWMEGPLKESFKGRFRPDLIWGKGATVYLRRTIRTSEFKSARPTSGVKPTRSATGSGP